MTQPSKHPEALKRYVRFDGEFFRFCEVGKDRSRDLRQGIVTDESQIPIAIKAEAIKRRGYYPSYVEWSF